MRNAVVNVLAWGLCGLMFGEAIVVLAMDAYVTEAGWLLSVCKVLEPFFFDLDLGPSSPSWLSAMFLVVPGLGYGAIGFTIALVIARRRCLEPYCCETCGYDLRGSRDRCPECGTDS